MELSQQLREMIREQEEQIRLLESAAQLVEQTDYLSENNRLREQLEEARTELDQASGRLARLEEDYRKTHAKLAERMQWGKDVLLANSRQQMGVYFAAEENGLMDVLTAQEKRVQERLGELRKSLSANKVPGDPELLEQLKRTEAMARERIERTTAQVREGMAAERARMEQGYAAIEAQPPMPAPESAPYPQAGGTNFYPQPVRARKQGGESLEMKIGGRIIHIAGLTLILLFVIVGLTNSYLYLENDVVKAAIAYLVGLLFLSGGEFMNLRNGKSPFSLGLCAGGVSILFAATAVNYFYVGLFGVPLALAFCVLTAAAALLLSLRYNSQMIAMFALLGGYLPMTALNLQTEPVMVISSMGYFLLLNLFVLLLALGRKWQPVKFFSIAANGLGMIYLMSIHVNPLAEALYILTFFLLYTAVVFAYPVLKRSVLQVSDTVLLAINSVLSCATAYYLLNNSYYAWYYDKLRLHQWNGLMALVFCLLFFGLGKGVSKFLEKDAGTKGLLYSSSLVFLVLGIPLQLLQLDSGDLITLGWLFEGVALCVFGIMGRRKGYRRAGILVSLLCLGWFLTVDSISQLIYGGDLYVWKYSAVTLGSLLILGALKLRYTRESGYWSDPRQAGARVLKYAALSNLWVYLMYLLSYLFDNVLGVASQYFWFPLSACVVTLAVAAGIKLIPVIRDRGVEIISMALYLIGFFISLHLNTIRPGSIAFQQGTVVAAVACLILCNLLAVAALYDCVRLAKGRMKGLPLQVAPIVMASFGLILLMEMLVVQARLSWENMIISLLLIAWALGMVIFGFVRRMAQVRWVGLGMAVFAVCKLFLLDWRIQSRSSSQLMISLLGIGVILLVISYVYQKFSKRLAVQIQREEELVAAGGSAAAFSGYGEPQQTPESPDRPEADALEPDSAEEEDGPAPEAGQEFRPPFPEAEQPENKPEEGDTP